MVSDDNSLSVRSQHVFVLLLGVKRQDTDYCCFLPPHSPPNITMTNTQYYLYALRHIFPISMDLIVIVFMERLVKHRIMDAYM